MPQVVAPRPTDRDSAGQPDVFFSYNSRDDGDVRKIAADLSARGTDIYLDRWYLQPGDVHGNKLAQIIQQCRVAVVFFGPHDIGTWQQFEILLLFERRTQDESFRLIPVILPGATDPPLGFLAVFSWVDMRAGVTTEMLDQLAEVCRSSAPSKEARSLVNSTWASVCPFRGLLPFREEDEPYFFGRELFTNRVRDLVERSPLVAVVGPSGSGKSSVVMAGLVPRLRRTRLQRQAEPGRLAWEIARLVPGDRPWRELATALLPVWRPDIESSSDRIARLREINSLQDAFQNGSIRPRDVMEDIFRTQTDVSRLLIVVDQWEELYTRCEDEHVRTGFIDELLATIADDRLRVVLTLRADFYGHALRHRALADRLDQSVINIGPLTSDELRRVIEQPPAKAGFPFDAGLVEAIFADLQTEFGSLPLLQYVLAQLWQAQIEARSPLDEYKAIGGLHKAIARQAELTWENLDEADRETARRLFLQLVGTREGEDYTRRRSELDDLAPAESPAFESTRRVIQRFVASRILVVSRDPASGSDILDLAHEALIKHWERLLDWLKTDREFLLWRRHLEFWHGTWLHSGQESSDLLKGRKLAEAMKWLNKRPEYLTPDEIAFIQASDVQEHAVLRVQELERETLAELADFTSLESCRAESDELWPPFPRMTKRLKALRDRCRKLSDRLPAKRATLTSVRELAATNDSATLRWQCDSLQRLIDQLEEFCRPVTGIASSLDGRIAFAETVWDRSIGQWPALWQEAISEIRATPAYRGLAIAPQIGLIPLGRDPQSGLYEFLHLQTHAGRIPRRDGQGRLTRIEDMGMILVLLPGGSFWMGAQSDDPTAPNFDPDAEENEGPVGEVALEPFLMSKYLATQGQWLRCVGANPSRYRPETSTITTPITLLHPVEDVTWHECVRMLAQLGLLLPTEAQWEYAARGGTTTAYATPPGVDAPEEAVRRYAHLLRSDKGERHVEIGQYLPNGFGLYDTLGNVWEWTRDRYGSFRDPARSGDGLRHAHGEFGVLRGCSFFNEASQARVAYRTGDASVDKRMSWLGFRAIRQLDGPEASGERGVGANGALP